MLMENEEHTLYPSKEKEVRLIRIYENKPCMRCDNYGKDVEWREVATSSSSEINVEHMRICNSCFNQLQFIWG